MFSTLESSSAQPERYLKLLKSLKDYPQDPIDNSVIERALREGLLNKEQCKKLLDLYTTSYNQALRACFPRDAYNHLEGARIAAANLEPHEDLILEHAAAEIQTLLQLPKPLAALSVKDSYLHFLRRKIQDFPYETTVKKLSHYINECLRRSGATGQSTWLIKARDAFRVLGYLHKCKESTHYSCTAEYDEMVRYGIDQTNRRFVHLRNSELQENTFDNMNKPTLIRLPDPDYSWLEKKDAP